MSSLSKSSISSSEKSISASISLKSFIRESLIELILFFRSPSICELAISSDFSVLALIISITASAWVRSILPFINALLVNSPG